MLHFNKFDKYLLFLIYLEFFSSDFFATSKLDLGCKNNNIFLIVSDLYNLHVGRTYGAPDTLCE